MFSLFTSIFWIDVELFIKKMLDISLQLSGFDVIIYFSDHGFDKDKAYFIQLLILMGKIMSPVPMPSVRLENSSVINVRA